MAGSHGNSVFNILRNFQTAFQSSGAVFYDSSFPPAMYGGPQLLLSLVSLTSFDSQMF